MSLHEIPYLLYITDVDLDLNVGFILTEILVLEGVTLRKSADYKAEDSYQGPSDDGNSVVTSMCSYVNTAAGKIHIGLAEALDFSFRFATTLLGRYNGGDRVGLIGGLQRVNLAIVVYGAYMECKK
ncbi:hypothetical protein LX32DRAFT_655065 [Colletotrichum zoysiae]|uniref:Uncharacterized protein n=1 Tax=Colletotrichum zoysiae TaxID=1216348 RepID=A0AAD9HBE5_9PEZI|nr:hypothetical protein LX32DRAFT_655065 [Colletotrichum zoysiae]